MSSSDERRFQIEMLKIEVLSNVINGFFITMIAVGLSALISINTNMIFAKSYSIIDVFFNSAIFVLIVMMSYVFWVILFKRVINKQIKKLENGFIQKRSYKKQPKNNNCDKLRKHNQL